MEDTQKLIDDIHLQKIDNLDSRVEQAISTADDDTLFMLGETLYNYGLTPQGLEVFRALYNKYPNEPELLIYFIDGLISEDKTDEALEYLSQADLSTERLMLEADLYQQINMLEVAIDKVQEAIELEPNDPVLHFALAELMYFDGQYLRASAEYETVLETGEYMVNGVNLYARLADSALQSGNYDDAIKLYDDIHEQDMTPEDFMKKALAYEKNELVQEAIKIMSTLMEKDPDYIQGYFYLQQLYLHQRDYKSAIEVGHEGLRLNAFYKELMLSTGKLELDQGDAEKGVKLLLNALEVDNAYQEPLIELSSYYRTKEDNESIIALLQYASEDDLDPRFMWNLAYALGAEERDKEAQHFFDLAYPTFENNPDFLGDYYFFLIETGQIAQAKQLLPKLLELDPNNDEWQQEAERLQYD
ncbi:MULTISPECIES: tetratricopeptide repeat protein [Staphylococcus]|uniref:tetratricopeptide repeat protein n=1 Tax=Staphylococcus TaxID=1279 RepID=UPI0008A524BE|nr:MULTISPECIES: tetratricopeptide repeat protein [Staphylococcus]MDT4012460.1 tetratricopeptide repeat protein [Staphylococcus simulans]OFJ80286.1 hypothetical protein HMPREF2846_04620 [Staphylococcus sp. HMSC056G08]UXR46564.1 tetratricopeptide repeat protein [Staphylococcus simulans]